MSLKLKMKILGGVGSSDLKLDTRTVYDTNGGDAAYAGVRVNRDGTIDERDNYGYYQVDHSTNWIELSAQTSTIGDAYEAKVTKTSGNHAVIGDFTDGVFQDITSDIEFYFTSKLANYTYVGTLEIREKATPANTVSATMTLEIN